jgi:hypothetical protein
VIGERLGISEDAARMRFGRALPKLARKVRELQRGEIAMSSEPAPGQDRDG